MFINRVKTFILIVALSMLLLLIGKLVGGYAGIQVAFIFALVINILAYFFSDKIVLAMYQAKPMEHNQYSWVYTITEELSSKMHIPMPKLWIIHASTANAFATGRNPSNGSVALTSGIIDILNKDELRGVIAHELAHIKNRDILIATIAATIATAISYMASMMRYTAFWGSMSNNRRNGNPLALILMSIIMPIAAFIIQLAISRNREYLADETGAKYSQDPLALASALEKLHGSTVQNNHYTNTNNIGKESTASLFIVNPFSRKQKSKKLINFFSTHPPIHKRIERLKKIYEKMFHI